MIKQGSVVPFDVVLQEEYGSLVILDPYLNIGLHYVLAVWLSTRVVPRLPPRTA